MPIIPADNTFAIGTILFGLAWLGFWIDSQPIGKKTSGVVWVLTIGMILSNIKIIPFAAPAYDLVGGTLVPLAIPLLLYKADLRRIFRESGIVMIIFCLACMATVVTAVAGFYIMELGEIGPKVAGVYTAGFVGGAVNFLAVSQAVQMTTQEFSVAIGASSFVSITALMLLIAIPSVRFITARVPSRLLAAADDKQGAGLIQDSLPHIRLTHISGAIALSFLICSIADFIAAYLELTQYRILFITIVTIIVANLIPGPLNKLQGDFEVGMLLMYLFFAMVGAGTDATTFLGEAFYLFIYGMFIILFHLFLVLAAARLFKIDLAEAVVASAAALVGPTATAAIAISKGWRDLVMPGIMCGIFGYVIATFIGVAVTEFLS
ncbi:MAG: DUF819 domain-containing protein [Gammaproteobacteria bacterium]